MGGQGIALGQFMSGETMKRAAVRLPDQGEVHRNHQIHQTDCFGREDTFPSSALFDKIGAVGLIEAKICDVTRKPAVASTLAAHSWMVSGARAGTPEPFNSRMKTSSHILKGSPWPRLQTSFSLVDCDQVHSGHYREFEVWQACHHAGSCRCIPVWRTQAGIDLAGPRWFGYDLDYIPYEQIRSVLA